MSSERNNTIDIARGLGLIAVSVYHLVYRAKDSIADQFIRECIWLVIPFFFVVSGYNYVSGKRTLKQNIVHRLQSLLFKTLKYTLVLLALGGVYCVVVHDYTIKDWLRDIIFTYLRPEFSAIVLPEWGYGGILFENISVVWFVWTMIFAYIIFYLVVELVLKSKLNSFLCVVIFLFVGISLYDIADKISWSLTLTPVYAAIMLCGVYVAKISSKLKQNIWLALVAVVIHVLMFKFFGSDLICYSKLGTVGKWSVIPFFVQAFIGTYALIVLCRILAKFNILSRIFAFIGRNSLSFLLLHCAFGVIFADIMNTYIKPGPYWYIDVTPEIFVKSLIGWLLSMICCSIFCIVREKLRNVD